MNLNVPPAMTNQVCYYQESRFRTICKQIIITAI